MVQRLVWSFCELFCFTRKKTQVFSVSIVHVYKKYTLLLCGASLSGASGVGNKIVVFWGSLLL